MSFQFESLAEFFAMNGHGAFVWGSYGFSLLCLLLLIFIPHWRRKQFVKEQRRRLLLESESNLSGEETD